LGHAIGEQHEAQEEHVVIAAVLRLQPIEEPERRQAEEAAEDRPHSELPEEGEDRSPAERLAGGEGRDGHRGQEDGHRVVGGALDLHGRRQPLRKGLTSEDGEDGGGVGGGDDHREQDRELQRPAQAEAQTGEEDERGEGDAPGGQSARGQGDGPEILQAGGKAALKEDEDEGQVGHPVGEDEVVEFEGLEDAATEDGAQAERHRDDGDAPSFEPDRRQHDGDQEDRDDDVRDVQKSSLRESRTAASYQAGLSRFKNPFQLFGSMRMRPSMATTPSPGGSATSGLMSSSRISGLS